MTRAGESAVKSAADIGLSAWELDCHVPLSSTLQVTRHLWLSVSTRQVPALPPPSGTQRARRRGLGPGMRSSRCKHAMVAAMPGHSDSRTGTGERRRQAIIAFLGTGMHDALTPALVVQKLADARRSVAACRARNESIATWLAGEIRFPGIKETPLRWPPWNSPSTARQLHSPARTSALT